MLQQWSFAHQPKYQKATRGSPSDYRQKSWQPTISGFLRPSEEGFLPDCLLPSDLFSKLQKIYSDISPMRNLTFIENVCVFFIKNLFFKINLPCAASQKASYGKTSKCTPSQATILTICPRVDQSKSASAKLTTTAACYGSILETANLLRPCT